MNTILDKRIIALTSKSGTLLNSSLKSNVFFNFPNLFVKDPSVAYAEVGVVSAEIPVSFYTINETNNTFATNLVEGGVGDILKSNVIPLGNYTATSLITQFLATLAASYAANTTEPLVSLTINRSNGKLAIGWVAPVAFNQITFFTSPFMTLLGFVGNRSLNPISQTAIATYPLSLLGINKIYMSTNNLLTYNYDSGKNGYSNILATIEVDAPPYGVILYKNQTNTYNILRNDDVNSFTIELKDDVGNYIDFNNIDWNITLALNIYRYIQPASSSKFSDVLGLGIKPPPEEEKKAEPKKDEPMIKNDLDLLTLPIKNNI
jgi:hypothetical protein